MTFGDGGDQKVRVRALDAGRTASIEVLGGVNGTCVVRYDNETGKGDHRHFSTRESRYTFETPEKLIADFQADIARWNHEDRHA